MKLGAGIVSHYNLISLGFAIESIGRVEIDLFFWTIMIGNVEDMLDD